MRKNLMGLYPQGSGLKENPGKGKKEKVVLKEVKKPKK